MAAKRRVVRTRPVCALIALGLLLAGCGPPPEPPRNAILIVLDTLRADRMSAYGAERRTTPVIDALAERGVLFETVVSNSSWTLPAMVGLLSGRYPTRAVYEGRLRRSLVEALRAAGFKTVAVTGGGLVGQQFGIDLGFDQFGEQSPTDLDLVPLAQLADELAGPAVKDIDKAFAVATRWLQRNHSEPFFLMLHTYEPHTPYRHRVYAREMDRGTLSETFEVEHARRAKYEGWRPQVEEVELAYIRALYDGGVRVSDHYVGRLLETLERLGRIDDTLIVVTSDHGEDLGDRSPPRPGNHGHALWDPLLLVPLVVFDPTRRYPNRRVGDQVRSIDTLPTILDLLGVAAEPGGDGRSLVPLMRGEEAGDRLAWAVLDPGLEPKRPVQHALRSGSHKLIFTEAGDGAAQREIQLYDLSSDPGERRDVSGERAEEVEAMLSRLEALRGRAADEGVPDFDPTGSVTPGVMRRLRELGYVE